MQQLAAISPAFVALALTALLAACQASTLASSDAPSGAPVFKGIVTRLLQTDLVQFKVRLTNSADPQTVQDYARCAAAQYTLIRGFGFARHVRTTVDRSADTWTADAVYTISADMPRGFKTIDAQAVAADCVENNIPMV